MINAIWEDIQVLCINSASSSKETKKDKEEIKKKKTEQKRDLKKTHKKNQNREGLQRVWLLVAAM